MDRRWTGSDRLGGRTRLGSAPHTLSVRATRDLSAAVPYAHSVTLSQTTPAATLARRGTPLQAPIDPAGQLPSAALQHSFSFSTSMISQLPSLQAGRARHSSLQAIHSGRRVATCLACRQQPAVAPSAKAALLSTLACGSILLSAGAKDRYTIIMLLQLRGLVLDTPWRAAARVLASSQALELKPPVGTVGFSWVRTALPPLLRLLRQAAPTPTTRSQSLRHPASSLRTPWRSAAARLLLADICDHTRLMRYRQP